MPIKLGHGLGTRPILFLQTFPLGNHFARGMVMELRSIDCELTLAEELVRLAAERDSLVSKARIP